ncbi:alpha/beta hydrolase [Ginsengibacter hankyongi]|uniref:Alpha/beta hydrolase n=1 Tax=Ginsengibacter hankyongi TaxID=2607284 RepID=A0A5J5IMB2_9BACT|nr:alpha/beta hydrolase [Ginsengibacter hankyongi]KAA9041217.1 alpha/beta hydrolase [Ginsengibacter hankyongi]
MNDSLQFNSGYSEVNGLTMYYEIYGSGKPLVLIHGGGSTIQTTFGNIIPELAKHRQVIAMELQAHGRTNDRPAYLSFEQDADDVAKLCKNLHIAKADFLGFSNGGQTTIEIALRYPALINKIIIASAFYKLSAVVPQFWDGFNHATLYHMPQVLREAYLQVTNNDEAGLLNMFNRDVQRMKTFRGWSDDQIKSIKAPALIINGTKDVGSVEHAVEMYRTISNSELAIFPGGHGTYLGSIESLEEGKMPAFNAINLIEEFLDK